MEEALNTSETSVLTIATRSNISEDTILLYITTSPTPRSKDGRMIVIYASLLINEKAGGAEGRGRKEGEGRWEVGVWDETLQRLFGKQSLKFLRLKLIELRNNALRSSVYRRHSLRDCPSAEGSSHSVQEKGPLAMRVSLQP
jgi:hypothetical protein